MFTRDITQRILAQYPGAKLSDPRVQKIIQAEAAAAWRDQWGGPATRAAQERRERESAQRGRTLDLLGEHPELTLPEAQARARGETQRIERRSTRSAAGAVRSDRGRRLDRGRRGRVHRDGPAGKSPSRGATTRRKCPCRCAS